VTGRIIVLAHAHDAGAAAVAAALARRAGRAIVDVVRPEALGVARWSHHVDPGGHVTTRLTLPRAASPIERVDCVLNRLQYLPTPRFHRASLKNRDFAAAELSALVMSWLGSLGRRVVNPVASHGMSATASWSRRWLPAAAACGLRVPRSVVATASRLLAPVGPGERVRRSAAWPYPVDGRAPAEVVPDETQMIAAGMVLVAGVQVVGALAPRVGAGCAALARTTGYPLLELRFAEILGALTLVSVETLPALDTPAAVAAATDLIETVAAGGGIPA